MLVPRIAALFEAKCITLSGSIDHDYIISSIFGASPRKMFRGLYVMGMWGLCASPGISSIESGEASSPRRKLYQSICPPLMVVKPWSEWRIREIKIFGILIFYCILLLGFSSLVCFTVLFEIFLPITDIGKRMKINKSNWIEQYYFVSIQIFLFLPQLEV